MGNAKSISIENNRQASTQSRRAALERIDKEIRLAQLELAELM